MNLFLVLGQEVGTGSSRVLDLLYSCSVLASQMLVFSNGCLMYLASSFFHKDIERDVC